MRMSRMRSAIAIGASVAALTALIQADAIKGGFAAAWGPLYDGSTAAETPQLLASAELEPTPPIGDMVGRVKHWNEISIDASGLDHTPNGVGDPHEFGEQLGPGRSARAMAIVHIAIFEVVIAVIGGYRSYLGLPRAPRGHVARRRDRAGGARYAGGDVPLATGRVPMRSSTGSSPRSRTIGRASRGSSWEGGGVRDPRAQRERRIEPRGAARRHRAHHQQPAGQMAAGSDQPDPARARREVGRGQAVRPDVGSISSARRRRRRCRAARTPRHSMR